MSATVETLDDPDLAITRLSELALSRNVVFRGHRLEDWKIQSTLARHSGLPISHADVFIRGMLTRFYGLLATTGKSPSLGKSDLRGRLEYARHYGLPTPLIDFTTSPYVALFFAFNGIRPLSSKADDYSVVYALDLEATASLYTQYQLDISSSLAPDRYADVYSGFLNVGTAYFKEGFPVYELQYLDLPASWNTRMQRQMGRFLYDTLDYKQIGFDSLEDFLTRRKETKSDHEYPALTKIRIPHWAGKKIFRHLDLAGISGVRLLDNYEGAIADVVNHYSYGGKHLDFWDQKHFQTED